MTAVGLIFRNTMKLGLISLLKKITNLIEVGKNCFVNKIITKVSDSLYF